MTQQSRPSFELLLGEVSLKAPETPLYLRLASQVLEARRSELENGAEPEPAPQPPAPPPPSPAIATLEPPAPAAEPVEAAEIVAVAPEPADPSEATANEQPDVAALEVAPEIAEETPADVAETAAAVEERPVEATAPEEPVAPPVFSSPEPSEPAAPVEAAPARRARWFRGQVPVVYFEDGSSQVMQSLDALKDLLRARGLTPHPRGDASMLLWQVRNRLGLNVGQVDM